MNYARSTTTAPFHRSQSYAPYPSLSAVRRPEVLPLVVKLNKIPTSGWGNVMNACRRCIRMKHFSHHGLQRKPKPLQTMITMALDLRPCKEYNGVSSLFHRTRNGHLMVGWTMTMTTEACCPSVILAYAHLIQLPDIARHPSVDEHVCISVISS